MSLRLFSRALALVLLLVNSAFAVQVHVSARGSDTAGNGTAANPYLTIEKALSVNGNPILVESGQYILSAPIVIPAGVRIRGGQVPETSVLNGSISFVDDSQPTIILALATSNQAAMTLGRGARLEWVTIAGGFYSLEMQPGSQAFEVEFLGGQSASAILRGGISTESCTIERCRVLGGGNGIRVDGNARASIIDTLIQRPVSNGIVLNGTGLVGIFGSIIQGNGGAGIQINGNSSVAVENCTIRKNTGAGILALNCSPSIRGCLVEKNQNGVEFRDTPAPLLAHCTILKNRGSGVYLRNGEPDLTANVVTDNTGYGVFEDKPPVQIVVNDDGTTSTIAAATHTGDFTRNLLWNNTRGAYLDEGETLRTTPAALNTMLVNTGSAAGNLVADPLYLDTGLSDYRPKADSPLIDVAPPPAMLTLDLNDNSRAVDIANVGAADTTVDLGAYEYNPAFVRNVGAIVSDSYKYVDPAFPNDFATAIDSPEWTYRESLYFDLVRTEFLPGRIRFYPTSANSFAAVNRRFDFKQPAGDVQVIRARTATTGDGGRVVYRVRTNGPEAFDISPDLIYLSDTPVGPPIEGREFIVVSDMRQGRNRDISIAAHPEYTLGLSFDFLDFVAAQTSHRAQDFLGLSIQNFNRTTFDAQFDTIAAQYSFDTGVDEWVPESVGPPLVTPRYRYEGTRKALEIEQRQDNSFGWWRSPKIIMKPGDRYRLNLTVSTDKPPAEARSFRVRVSAERYEFQQEMLVLAFLTGGGGPGTTSTTYSLYGYVPPEIADSISGEDGIIEMYIFFELWGFPFDTRSPQGKLWLENATVRTASNPLY